MSKRQRRVFTDEFKREVVGLIASSGRTTSQVADDLGLGISILKGRKQQQRETGPEPQPSTDKNPVFSARKPSWHDWPFHQQLSKVEKFCLLFKNGAPERIRTSDP